MSMATIFTEAPQVFRPLAKFLPNLWGDLFTSFSVDITVRESYVREHDDLKEKVRAMFQDTPNYKIQDTINLISTTERLGVSYHFEKEIEALLHQMFDAFTNSQDDVQQFDLCTLGNYFRILRQHGYKISCGIFDKLIGEDGEFKDDLSDDVIGMLSLYEASYVRTHGESILDEALIYTKARLGFMAASTSLCQFLKKQVSYALNQPLHKGIPRIESRNYISFYEEDPNKNDELLRFSKIDFNLLQMIYRQEICDITRWWNDLEFESKLPYSRSRVAEGYLWPLSVYHEPKYSLGRIILTKIILLVTVTDDTYDAYGTPEELTLFTNAIERWNISAIDELPDYMKFLYGAHLNLFDKIENQILKQEDNCSYGVAYTREMYIELIKGYEAENILLRKRYVPSFEQYMKNGLVTSVGNLLVTTSYLGLGKDAPIQAFEWLKTNSKMMIAANTIARLLNDIIGHEEEDERLHIATGVECYMKEHGVTREEVIIEFNKINDNAWKDMNMEIIARPNNLPLTVLTRTLNLTRGSEFIYRDGEGYTHPETLENYVTLMFIDPIAI